MGDITKIVKTLYKLDAKQAEAGARRLQKRMTALGRVADKVTGRIGAMGRMLAAPAGLGLAGAAGLVKHLVDVGSEAQTAELSITGLIQAVSRSTNLPLQGFEKARATAQRLRKEFIRLAQDSPIAADDVKESFEAALFPLTQAGFSLQQQAELARGVAIADLGNRVKGAAAGDIRDIFAGQGSAKRIQTSLLKPISEAAAKLAKSGKIREAANLIQKALTPDPKLLEAFGKSAGGSLATFGDKLTQIKQKIAGPLLDFLVEKTTEWGEWLDANQDKVADIAKSIGKGIVKAVKGVIKVVKFLAKHWKTILTIVKVLVGVWIVGKLAKGLSTIIGLASRFAAAMRGAAAAARAAAVASASAGGGRKGGLAGKLGKVAGAASLAILAATEGEEVGTAGAKLFTSAEQDKRIARAASIEARIGPSMSKEEYKAFIANQQKKGKTPSKLEEDALKAQLDPTKVKRRGRGGGGSRKVKRMTVERFEVRDRDFSRLSSKFAVGVRRESRAMRQITGLGLGAGAVGVGVQ